MFICQYCGKQQPVKKGTTNKYCSNVCQGAHTSQKIVDAWLNNQTPETFYNKAMLPRPAIRAYLIIRSECKCSRCGWDKKHPSSKMPPLELEHIDGDWENCNIDNIDVICPNCHSLTDTYKARNMGNGRSHRRQ